MPEALGGCRSCPADLRTHWALVWMGVLLGATCLLLLLLMKKEDMKGEWYTSGGCAWPGTPPGTSLPLLSAGWLKSLRAGYGSKGECGLSLGPWWDWAVYASPRGVRGQSGGVPHQDYFMFACPTG